jgi:ABC-type dipeptide/oligopeptide/nickel transport system permease component
MSKRDIVTTFLISLLVAEIVVTSLSLLFNSIPVFWVGQIVAIVAALVVTPIADENQNKDRD